MARSRLVAGGVLVAALVAGGWLVLTRSSRSSDQLDLAAAAPATPSDTTFSIATGAVAGAERDAQAQPASLVPDSPGPASVAPPSLLLVRITGLVARSTGTPLADAEVRLAASADADELARAATTRTLPDGTFALELTGEEARLLLDRDDWLIVRRADTEAVVREVPMLGPGDRELGVIVLAEGAGLRGRIVGSDGAPAPDVLVRVRALAPDQRRGGQMIEDPDLRQLDEAVANATRSLRVLRTPLDGTFAFAGLPDGAARLEIEPRSARRVIFTDLALHSGGLLDLGDILLDEGLVIEGVVLTSAGQPAASALVRAERERPPVPERDGAIQRTGLAMADQWTDEAGRFRLVGLARGTFQLFVQAEGQGTTVASAQAGERGVQVRMLEPATVLLELRDAHTDGPIQEANITGQAWIKLANGASMGTGNRFQVTHGEEAHLPSGTWSVSGLAEVPTTLNIDAPGYSSATLEVPPLAPGKTLVQRLSLERPLHVRGVVVDSLARPIADAVVQIAPTAGPALGQSTKMVRTDASGSFLVDSVGRGTWQMWAYAEGFVGQAQGSIELADSDLAGVALRLIKGATLAGSALTSRGDVVPDARVAAWIVRPLAAPDRPVPEATLVFDTQDRPPRAETRSEAEGVYRLGPLLPGEYLVAAALPADVELSYRLRQLAEAPPSQAPLPAGVVRVTVAAGDERALDLMLPRPARVTGFVRAGGRGLAEARVALVAGSDSSWALVRAADSDALGAFEMVDLPPLEGAILACGPGEVLPRWRRVTLAEGSDVTVELAFDGPGLTGTVVDVATRRPASGVPVWVRLVEPVDAAADPWVTLGGSLGNLMSQAGMPTATMTSDAAGRFSIPHLVPGTWSAIAYGNGWLGAGQISFEVDADWTPDDIQVPVKSGAVVEGSVRWAFAGPADAELEVGLYKPVENTVACVASASHGTYRLDGLQPGDYELRVRHMVGGGGTVHVQPVTLAAGQHVTIDLQIED